MEILLWIVVALFAVLFILSIYSYILRNIDYKSRYVYVKRDISLIDYTKSLLNKYGLNDVIVERANIFKTLLWGNTYSARKNKIILSYFPVRRYTIDNIVKVSSLVALAKMNKEGNLDVKKVSLQRIINTLPALLLPLMLIGLVLDAIFIWKGNLELSATYFIFTISLTFVGLLITLFAFIISLRNVRTLQRANNIAYDFILGSNILPVEYNQDKLMSFINRINKGLMLEVINNSLYFVYLVFKLILNILTLSNKNRTN